MKHLLFILLLLPCLVSTMAQDSGKMILNASGVYYHNLQKIDNTYGFSVGVGYKNIYGVLQPQPRHAGVLGGYIIHRYIGNSYINITPLVGFQYVDNIIFDYGVSASFIPLRNNHGKNIGVTISYTQYSLSVGVVWLLQ